MNQIYDEPMVRVALSIPKDLAKAIKNIAKGNKMKKAAVMRHLMEIGIVGYRINK